MYDVRDESELYPDRKEFGFAYMSTNEITEDYIKHKVMKEMNIEDEEIFNKLVMRKNEKGEYYFSLERLTEDELKYVHSKWCNGGC